MVKRIFAGSVVLSGVLVVGCDPFAPSEPEAPSAAGSVQMANRAEVLPSLWAKGLSDDNVLQTVALVGEGFQGAVGGSAVSRSAFVSCLERLATDGVDTARFAWRNPPTGSPDSVSGDIDWSMVKKGGTRFGGRATWAAVRDDAAEWRLARWSEPSTPGNWSDACGGF